MQYVLEQEFGYKQVVCVTNRSALLDELEKAAFSHLILDVTLSDGTILDLLPAIHSRYPALAIMVYSGKPAAIYRRVLRQYGIQYFLPKEADEATTVRSLRRFLYGEPPPPLSPASPAGEDSDKKDPFALLTTREKEILHYVLKGWGSNVIGKTLHLRQNTVSTVKGRIFEKTETSNLHELLELAVMFKVVL